MRPALPQAHARQRRASQDLAPGRGALPATCSLEGARCSPTRCRVGGAGSVRRNFCWSRAPSAVAAARTRSGCRPPISGLSSREQAEADDPRDRDITTARTIAATAAHSAGASPIDVTRTLVVAVRRGRAARATSAAAVRGVRSTWPSRTCAGGSVAASAGRRRSRRRLCPTSTTACSVIRIACSTAAPSTSSGARPVSWTTRSPSSSTTSMAWCGCSAGSSQRTPAAGARPTSARPLRSSTCPPASGPVSQVHVHTHGAARAAGRRAVVRGTLSRPVTAARRGHARSSSSSSAVSTPTGAERHERRGRRTTERRVDRRRRGLTAPGHRPR